MTATEQNRAGSGADQTRTPWRRWVQGIYAALPLKQPLFEVTRRVAHVPHRVYRHLHFQGDFRVAMNARTSFLIRHYGHQVENDLFWVGYGNGWEATSLRLWARLARGARVILDIGVNTGVYSLAAEAVNHDARVFAFEPIQRIADRLKTNIALNRFHGEVIVAGVSDATGHSTIFEPVTDHSYSASLERSMLGGQQALVETRIPVTRVDDFMTERGLESVDLVKIDTEKHELSVLNGFGGLIATSRPVVLIEILDPHLVAKVKEVFAPHDYTFYEVIEGKGIFLSPDLTGPARNHLLCPRSLAETMGFASGIKHESLSI